jgi:hypothetical protein
VEWVLAKHGPDKDPHRDFRPNAAHVGNCPAQLATRTQVSAVKAPTKEHSRASIALMLSTASAF